MKAPRHGGIVLLVSVLCNRVMDQDVDATPLCAHCIVNKKLLSTSLSFFFFPFFFFSIINQIINHYTCYSVTNKLKIPLLRDEFSFSRHVVASLISKTFRISIVLRISWMVRRKFVIFFQSISTRVHAIKRIEKNFTKEIAFLKSNYVTFQHGGMSSSWDRNIPFVYSDPFREDGRSFPYLTARPVLSTLFIRKSVAENIEFPVDFGIFIESRRW